MLCVPDQLRARARRGLGLNGFRQGLHSSFFLNEDADLWEVEVRFASVPTLLPAASPSPLSSLPALSPLLSLSPSDPSPTRPAALLVPLRHYESGAQMVSYMLRYQDSGERTVRMTFASG